MNASPKLRDAKASALASCNSSACFKSFPAACTESIFLRSETYPASDIFNGSTEMESGTTVLTERTAESV